MSGPIVRKYGFPNFENIFGKREMKHGVDEPEPAPPAPEPAAKPGTETPPAAGPPKAGKKQSS